MILAAVLADVAEMRRPALPAIHWEAEAESHLSALLGRGTSVSEVPVESIKLLLEAALTIPPMYFRVKAVYESFLAPAAHEDAGLGISMAPLLVNGLLGRMSLPLPSSISRYYSINQDLLKIALLNLLVLMSVSNIRR